MLRRGQICQKKTRPHAMTTTPVYFKTVDLRAHLDAAEPLRRDGRIYVADLTKGPLTIQTPALEILTLTETFAWTKPTGHFATFLHEAEDVLKATCEEAAESWGITKDQVRASFKTFFREDGAFKVRLGPDFAVFDEAGEQLDDPQDAVGKSVRAALAIDKLCLGKTEMGGMWSLLQVRLTPPPPPCLIDPDLEVPDDHETVEDAKDGDEEFL